jgi:SlyX protein
MNHDIQDALIELETRVAFQEDTLNQLNDVIVKQDAEILLLREQLRVVVKRVEELSRQPSVGAVAELDERPPHY